MSGLRITMAAEVLSHMDGGEVTMGNKVESGDNGLRGSCPTLDSLLALGFEPGKTGVQVEEVKAVCYRFACLDLDALHVMNLYARQVILLSGVLNTGRTLATIESQIPDDLGNAFEAAAWVSYALKSHRNKLEPLPDWFLEGEAHWDLVPPARKMIEARERQRAYLSCPRCYIDRDYARPLRRNLLEELSGLAGETQMTVSFDGRVLSIDLKDRIHEVLASGDCWPSSYEAIVGPEAKMPTRFESPRVEVSVFEGYVCFDRLRLGSCEPGA